MIEIMRRDFCEHRQMQNPITQNQFGTMRRMSEVAEQVTLPRNLTQPVNDSLFPWEEVGSVENPFTIEEDEEFSEPWTPLSDPPNQSPAMEAIPGLRSNENF